MSCENASCFTEKTDEWYVNITVQKQAHLKRKYTQVLPVDMGIRKLATTIEDGKPHFYGKKVRAIRGHHYHLRRSVGKPSIIKKWKHREQSSVRHEVHAITRKIVDHAKRMNAVIVIGDLGGIRNQNRGKRGEVSIVACLGNPSTYSSNS